MAAVKEATLEERLDAVVAEVGRIVEEIDAAGKAAVEEAESAVWRNLRRFESAQKELEDLTRREQALHEEREDLPLRHSRCVLEDDEQGASRTKSRYTEIRAELDTIAARRPELEEAIAEFGGPNIGRLPEHLRATGVQLAQRDRVSRALDVGLDPLNRLEKEVVAPVMSALGRQKGRAAQHVGAQQSLNEELRHDPMMSQSRREATRAHVNPARSTG